MGMRFGVAIWCQQKEGRNTMKHNISIPTPEKTSDLFCKKKKLIDTRNFPELFSFDTIFAQEKKSSIIT